MRVRVLNGDGTAVLGEWGPITPDAPDIEAHSGDLEPQ